MKPASHDLTIYVGDSFSRKFRLKDSAGVAINITGWVFLSQIRNKAGGTLIETFAGQITNATGGEFTLSLTSTQTRAIVAGRYVWDVQRTDPAGLVRTLLFGKVIVLEDISRV